MSNFDTIEELEQIKDLDVLNEAIKVRTEVYQSGQVLHNFVLNIGGIQLLFDNTGGLLRIQRMYHLNYVYQVEVKLLEKTPCYLQYDYSWSFDSMEIPDANEKCDYCQEKWTLRNFHNKVEGEDGKHYHNECKQIVNHKKETGNIGELLKKSGFIFNPKNINGSSFSVFVQYGLFKFNVTDEYTIIDWSGMHKPDEISLLFLEEKGVEIVGESIHTFSEEKVLEYLTKIHDFYNHK